VLEILLIQSPLNPASWSMPQKAQHGYLVLWFSSEQRRLKGGRTQRPGYPFSQFSLSPWLFPSPKIPSLSSCSPPPPFPFAPPATRFYWLITTTATLGASAFPLLPSSHPSWPIVCSRNCPFQVFHL
jgi:hypothetical protein